MNKILETSLTRRKFLKQSIVGLLLLTNNTSSNNILPSKIKEVYNWLISGPKNSTISQISPVEILRSIVEEEDISKLQFKHLWKLHNLQTTYFIDNNKLIPSNILYVSVRNYKALITSHSRQFLEYNLVDSDIDGKVDRASRRFEILQSDEDESDAPYFFISPDYPEDFINKNFYKVHNNLSQKIYDEEINYWSNKI